MKSLLSLLLTFIVTVTLQAQTLETVRNANDFTIDLYKECSSSAGQQNVVLSPYSISSALAMMYPGAHGKTAEEMKKALHFSDNVTKQNEGYQLLNAELQKAGSPMTISNILWLQVGTNFKPEFLKTSATYFGANFREVSFAETDKTKKLINSTLEQQTNGKIKDLIDGLNVDTKLMLTNAIYFKDAWVHPFNKNMTKGADFFPSPNMPVKASFMNNVAGRYKTFENNVVSILELPFEHENFSFQILLPKISLEKFESAYFSADVYPDWELAPQDFDLISIPRFTMERKTDVIPVLNKFGMIEPFKEVEADFSGITDQRIGISDIYHKVVIEVNEEGAEAAGLTAVGAVSRGYHGPARQFIADHPFIFLIRDNSTGSILFIGKFVNP